ncbi:MAG TPA: hypothetical protein VD978_25640 [Azospirillum sp.]|nr:hypothetical protein [Azospirillum sp.]
MSSLVETITDNGRILAYVVRAGTRAERTTFVTGPDAPFQLGFIVYPKGGEVARHFHKPVERHLTSTSEAILVRSGACEVDFFDDARALIRTVALQAGDLVMTLAGGHGYRMTDDCVLLEIKQGPYPGLDEKERFA